MTTFCSLKPKLLKNYCYSFVTQLFSYHSNNFFEGRTVANTPYPPVSVTGCSLHVLDYLLTCKTCFLPYVASETSLIYVRVPIVSTRGVQIRSETDPIRCTPIVSTVIINKTYWVHKNYTFYGLHTSWIYILHLSNKFIITSFGSINFRMCSSPISSAVNDPSLIRKRSKLKLYKVVEETKQ